MRPARVPTDDPMKLRIHALAIRRSSFVHPPRLLDVGAGGVCIGFGGVWASSSPLRCARSNRAHHVCAVPSPDGCSSMLPAVERRGLIWPPARPFAGAFVRRRRRCSRCVAVRRLLWVHPCGALVVWEARPPRCDPAFPLLGYSRAPPRVRRSGAPPQPPRSSPFSHRQSPIINSGRW